MDLSKYFDEKYDRYCHSFGRTMKDRGFDTRIKISDENDDVILDELHNVTTLGGSLAMSEYIFRLPTNQNQRNTLNQPGMIRSDEIPTPSAPGFWSSGEARNRSVDFFTIGNGAETIQAYGYNEAQRYEQKLYGHVPFRTVREGNDLTPEERQNYRLRATQAFDGVPHYLYYAKRFDKNQSVNVQFNNSAYLPVIAHSRPLDDQHELSGGEFRVFTVITLSINELEFKEWHRLNNQGSLRDARLSELGLIFAKDGTMSDGRSELIAPELFSKLTHEPYPMSREGSRRTVEYIIYT